MPMYRAVRQWKVLVDRSNAELLLPACGSAWIYYKNNRSAGFLIARWFFGDQLQSAPGVRKTIFYSSGLPLHSRRAKQLDK